MGVRHASDARRPSVTGPSTASSASCALGAHVPALLRVEVELDPRLPCLGGEPLGELDPVDEPPARRAQGELGVDVDDAGDVDDGEEEVAELGEHARVGLGLGRGPAGPGELDLELGDLLPHLRERALEIGPVEPDRRCAALHLAGVEQAGKRLGHVVEDAGAPLLLGLDRLPALAHPTGRVRLGLPEDVRVAADELRVHGPGDRFEVALALLLEQQREEVGLEEQVAELVEELGGVAGVGGVGDLVGLLDRVRHDRPGRLLAIPGAVAAQALRQLLQLDERLGERH